MSAGLAAARRPHMKYDTEPSTIQHLILWLLDSHRWQCCPLEETGTLLPKLSVLALFAAVENCVSRTCLHMHPPSDILSTAQQRQSNKPGLDRSQVCMLMRCFTSGTIPSTSTSSSYGCVPCTEACMLPRVICFPSRRWCAWRLLSGCCDLVTSFCLTSHSVRPLCLG